MTTDALSREKNKLSVAVTGFESDFPVLTRAAHRAFQASAFTCEWDIKGQAGSNHFQIVRTPWGQPAGDTADRREEMLHQHLTDIELSLVHGFPRFDRSGSAPRGFCGGVLHYLGRMPNVDDYVRLATLGNRELLFIEYLQPGGSTTHEWLSEFSLVVAGEPEPASG